MALGNGKPRAGGRAVLRRADRRPHAERAGVPAAGRPGADLVDGGAPRGDLLQHAPFLRRDGPLHARRRPRVSRPRHSGDASEGRRQAGPREDLRSPASTRRGRRSSSNTSSGTARSGEARLDIPKIAVDRPQTLAATVRAGRDGIERLDLRREGRHREGRARRADQAQPTRRASIARCCPAEQAPRVFANLNRLRARGLYRDALAYHDLGARSRDDRLGAREQAGHRGRRDARAQRIAGAVSRHQEAAADARDVASSRPRLVQWDTPIPPPEAYEHPREDVGVQGSDRLQGRARAISAKTSGRWT